MYKKVAFICPLYDMKNHFDLAFNLFKSKWDLHIREDLYFVFSNEEQMEKFNHRIFSSFKKTIQYLILPNNLLDYKSKVVVKKLWALQQLYDKYDYLALVDSESLFIKKTDFSVVFEDIWNKRNCLKANISYDGFYILRKCFITMGLYFNKRLIEEFGFYRYNFWFNEIQVYKCDNLAGFFNWLNKFDKNAYLNEGCCFEYYLYAAYLILEKDYHIIKMKDLKSMGGIMEYLPEFKTDRQKFIIDRLDTHWSSNPKVVNENTYMLFHLDRINKDGYSYGKYNETKENIHIRIRIFKDIVKRLLGQNLD